MDQPPRREPRPGITGGNLTPSPATGSRSSDRLDQSLTNLSMIHRERQERFARDLNHTEALLDQIASSLERLEKTGGAGIEPIERRMQQLAIKARQTILIQVGALLLIIFVLMVLHTPQLAR